MTTIRVALGERSYPIVVSRTYRGLARALRTARVPQAGWVVTHPRLLRQHGRPLLAAFRAAGWTLRPVVIPESETSKSWAVAERLIWRLSKAATMRPPLLVAFGGGVVGDVTGFVAAVLRRGIPYVQVPTTLLAQVDSAIGGKVGVDLPHAKNFVGAFYQPRLVYSHTGLVRTLPLRQRRSGLAEVIKYGVIADPELFRFLERHLAACLRLEPRAVETMVVRSCRIKARIVSRDERETHGDRALLNFGHTVGHALEAATRYQRWTHGEAIAIGMRVAGELAAALGLWAAADQARLVRLLRAAGLPMDAAGVSRRAVFKALRYDKKFIHGRPRWVLPRKIGDAVVTEAVPWTLARRVISRFTG